MLKSGANPNGDSEGRTPLQIAILEGQREIAKLLLNSGVDPNGKFQFNEQYLNLAIDSSQPEIAENLIRKGAKVNLKGPFGLTVLRNAVVNEMEGMVRLLLKHGARISDSEENKKIMSLLTFSVAKNNVGIVRLLLKHGAKFNKPFKDTGQYPIHQAMAIRSHVLVKLLVDHGADLSVRNRLNQQPLDLIFGVGRTDPKFARFVVRFLIPLRWAVLRKKDQRADYLAFIRKFPDSDFQIKARGRIAELDAKDDRDFARILETNRVRVFHRYLEAHPNGRHRNKAFAALVDLSPVNQHVKIITQLIRKYPDSAGLLPPRLTLYFVGPKKLQVHNLLDYRRQGIADDVLVSMIRAKQGVYKVFLGEEVLALNRLGFSGPVIDAMIQTTRNSQSEEKRRLAEQETQAEMRKLRAQLQKMGTELKALQRQQKQEMENRSTSGLGGGFHRGCGGRMRQTRSCVKSL